MRRSNSLLLLSVAMTCLLQVIRADSCYPPKIEHGYATSSEFPIYGRYRIGSVVYFQCKSGYEMKGDRTIRCRYGNSWDGQIPRCYAKKSEKYCQSPSRFFGGEYYPVKPQYHYNDKVHYRCPGYSSKYIYSTCSMEGKWKQASKCYDYCKKPEMNYGYYEPMKQYYYHGDSIKYSCNDKYYKYYEGEKYEMSTCGEDGYWDKKKPMCKKYCEVPDYKMFHHQPYGRSRYEHGEKMQYYCEEDYYKPSKYNYYESECMSDGKWNRSPYKCERRCTAPDYDDYYHMPYSKEVYGYGDKMMYSCKDGYYKPSDYDYSYAMCKSDGNWDKKPYKCMKYCRAHKMQYGKYQPMKDMYKYGDKMYYECDSGYDIYYKEEKYEYNTCNKHGMWDRMTPMCKKYCKAPQISYGSYSPKSKSGKYNVGDRMYYSCKDGYKLFYGEEWYEYNTCQKGGKWLYKEPSCRSAEKYCDSPHMPHGSYSPQKSRYSYNDKVYYQCKDGYKLHYDSDWFEYSTCMKNGKWDFRAPSCMDKKMYYCKQPYINHGSYSPMKKMYSKGDRIYYSCKDGYKKYYDEDWFEYSTCNEDGNWDYNPPKCKAVHEKYCYHEEYMHGDYHPKMKRYSVGDRIYYDCHKGYRMKYDEDWYEYRTCGKDGRWDYKSPRCMKVHSYTRYCHAPYFMHGNLRPMKNAYSHGEKVYYYCKDGYMTYYKNKEYKYSTCNYDGTWDNPAPMCKSMYKNYCYAPQMKHGSYYPTMKMYNSGDRLRYKCDYGYNIYYENERYEYTTCMRDGNWDRKHPMCKSNKMYYCDKPMIQYGMYKPMKRMYNPGDRMYYSCKQGYQLKYGKDWFEYNTCNDDGKWRYKAPDCMKTQKKYCDSPKIKHGEYNPIKHYYSYGDKVYYKCHRGYKLYYDNDWFEYSTCKEGGYWYPKEPMCKEEKMKYCYPPDYHHGSYYPKMRMYSHGERMYYKCDYGYKMYYHDEEYEYNTCMDGKWKKKAPKCMDMRKKYCQMPYIMHGSYQPMRKMFSYGDRVWYSCKSGYYMKYDGDRYEYSSCMSNGNWDKKAPKCMKRDMKYCMAPYMKHGEYYPMKSRYNVGDKLYYNCKSGYGMRYHENNYQYSTCKSDGNWDNKHPMCMDMKKKYCSAPKVDHADYSPMKAYYKYADRVYISCHYGYYRSYSGYQMEYSSCKENGKWDVIPTCKTMAKKYCKAPERSHYHHKSYAKKQYMEGEWIKYECDHGYYRPSNMKYNYAICKKDGTWTASPYKCNRYCMSNDMRYGSYEPMKKYYEHGERVSYKCYTGYYMKYQKQRYQYRTCQNDGEWDYSAPMCMNNRY
ncbi:complement factor H-like [Styela clava]